MRKNEQIKRMLFDFQDLKYKDFHSKLIPNVNPDNIIGVRMPKVFEIGKKIKDDEEISAFIHSLPHQYYEENNLHSFLVGQIKDFYTCIEEINKFLPYVDNWATCDSLRPKCFKNNKDKLVIEIKNWISSKHTYTIRFGIEMLMVHFLEDKFDVKYLDDVANIESDEYYVNMMIAWFFATALSKQYASAVIYIEQNQLPVWIHNKTIQKAVESYRITDDAKEYLKSLKKR